jgi:hypothetical protein
MSAAKRVSQATYKDIWFFFSETKSKTTFSSVVSVHKIIATEFLPGSGHQGRKLPTVLAERRKVG